VEAAAAKGLAAHRAPEAHDRERGHASIMALPSRQASGNIRPARISVSGLTRVLKVRPASEFVILAVPPRRRCEGGGKSGNLVSL